MLIKGIKLINFRNYLNLETNFSSGLNVFVGENAQGKTNLLEAVYISISGKSFRTHRDKEVINLKSNQAYTCVLIESQGLEKKIEQMLDRNKNKRLKLNGKEIRSFKELNNISMVVFSPDDLSLIKGSPQGRRSFFDDLISSLNSEYRHSFSFYMRALMQRNNILKDKRFNNDILSVFDRELCNYGAKIIYYRHIYMKKIERLSGKILQKISGEKESLKILYSSSIIYDSLKEEDIKRYLESELKKNIEKDKIFQTTSTGPHRDDYTLYINSRDSRLYGSQGQQRSLVLALKLGQIELYKEEFDRRPVLLLDDVFSELDGNRRILLSEYVKDMQTFLTVISLEELEELSGIEKRVFEIKDGKLINKNGGLYD